MQEGSRYGFTAARSHGKPGRESRSSSVTVDAHAHAWIEEAAKFTAPHINPNHLALTRFANEKTQRINRQQDAERRPLMTDWRRRLADMDEMGVDVQIVLPSPSQTYYFLPIEIAAKAASIINDGIAAMVANRPDRMVPFGSVPMQDGNAAAEELERCVRKLGFKGVQILTNVAGHEISEPVYAPFWKKAEELGAAVLLHPAGFTHAERMTRFYFNNVVGQPLETAIALHYLIFDGVLERHPNLKIIAVHGGGYLGAYSGRIDHAWGARADAHGTLPHPPTTYLKRLYVDTVVFTPHQLEAIVKVFGVDHVLMGTDYPFDMAEYDPIGHVNAVDTLSPADVAAITGGNAKRLFGL
jgi:aminocarboxymuconate-semialdehyde decarboxylase